MKLSIITINLNNAGGLERTLQSVATQSFREFEYIIVDGESTDNSVEIIKEHEMEFVHLKWVSEPDTGIYNAMNKGLRMANGEYVQVLNSGDCLAAFDVTEKMLNAIGSFGNPNILYGNMMKSFEDGRMLRDRCFAGRNPSMLDFVHGTLNHNPTYICKHLFERFGYYREDLSITADWRWFVEAIPLGGVKPVYVDIDVTVFDMTGVSETQIEKREKERDDELKSLLPVGVYDDYKEFGFPIEQYCRLRRYPLAYKFFYLIERVFFKFEKLQNKKRMQQVAIR